MNPYLGFTLFGILATLFFLGFRLDKISKQLNLIEDAISNQGLQIQAIITYLNEQREKEKSQ